MASFQNRAIAILGGASGMGLATTQVLLARQARVAVFDVSADNLHQFYAQLPAEQIDHCMVIAGNVTDEIAVQRFLLETKSRFGGLNGVANFAGTPGHELSTEAIWQTTQEEYQFIMDINVKGLFNVLSVALRPDFLDYSSSVVHIGSMFSLQGFKNGAIFAASKHAALGMVRSVAKETNGKARVNCVLPYVFLSLFYEYIYIYIYIGFVQFGIDIIQWSSRHSNASGEHGTGPGLHSNFDDTNSA